MSKECKKCKKIKPLSDFYKDRSKVDLVTMYCKECLRLKYWKRRDKIADVKKIYKQSEKGRAARRKYDRKAEKKVKVHHLVSYALIRGELIRPDTCSVCDVECKPIAHHEDYDQPYKVDWMCHICHMEKHRSCLRSRLTGSG